MERSGRFTRWCTVLLMTGCLGACASTPSGDDGAAPKPQVDPKAARENAENNLAYAKDQASLWLEAQQDRCAAASGSDRDHCAAAAKVSYEAQVAAAQKRYDAICREADADLRAAAAAPARD